MTLTGRQGEQDGHSDDVNGRPHREQLRRCHRHAIPQFRGRRRRPADSDCYPELPIPDPRLGQGGKSLNGLPQFTINESSNPTILVFLRRTTLEVESVIYD